MCKDSQHRLLITLTLCYTTSCCNLEAGIVIQNVKYMSAKQVWVSPADEGWKVQSANASRAAAIVETKTEAVELAREIAIK